MSRRVTTPVVVALTPEYVDQVCRLLIFANVGIEPGLVRQVLFGAAGAVESCGHCHDDPPFGHTCPRCRRTSKGTDHG